MREGVLRYDTDLGGWCFDEETQIETVQPGEIFRIRYLDRYQRGQIQISQSGEWQILFGGAKKSNQWSLTLKQGQMYPAKQNRVD